MNKVNLKTNINQRRQLKNHNLELMLTSSEYLLEDFVELEAQYIGHLAQVSKKFDITNKIILLNLMKDAQSQSILPKILTRANDSIFRINAYILEILNRDTEKMIHGIPVHNISNICYAKETENSHIIAVQHGDTYQQNEFFNVLLLVVNSKNEAENICQLLKRCFEVLYIERTMSLLDQVVGDETMSHCSSSVSVVARRNRMNRNHNIKLKNFDDVKSIISLKINNSTDKKDLKKEHTRSESLNDSAYETIEDFINQLRRELNKKEYEAFGLALAQWQKGEQFDKFCMKALEIVGYNRIHIFIGLKPFVPKDNLEWFKNFLKVNYDEQLYSAESFNSDSSFDSDSIPETLVKI
ncbi:unnamed protein product [Brachionus calyciflorus]|uniref:Cerebral cavernous malformations 2 harmonin-homology domain-containing protein n=1 Tax=Brachionus calyciflorus TaxID=104777 RepID=A0A813X493_9BILA|nr:unnamed protein product [Brachionus calyciflorus]